MLESQIEKNLCTRVKLLGKGVLCLKFVSPGCTGVPDRIILLPGGKVIFVELKRPKKKERVRQLYIQERLRDLGFPVYSSVDSDAKIDEVIDRCRNEINEVYKRGV